MADIVTFDDFLNGILLDYRGQNPDVDISPATLAFIKSASIASMLWGMQKQIEETGKKPFPDLCSLEDLKHWGQIKGIQNVDSLIDTDGNYTRLANAVLEAMQNPQSAGNKFDWKRWSMDCVNDHISYMEKCANAFTFENKRNSGSVDVVIISDRTESDGGEQDPSSELLAVVTAKLEEERNLGIASDFMVYAPSKVVTAVYMTVSAGTKLVTDAILSSIQSQITDYLKSIPVGGTLYKAQLEAIAINNGVNVESLTPSDNVLVANGPNTYERIWPDTNNISITRD
jgi:uncharacterized phage protein gp47/JayE